MRKNEGRIAKYKGDGPFLFWGGYVLNSTKVRKKETGGLRQLWMITP